MSFAPEISVIVPTGRVVHRVRPTMESCLAQQFDGDFEVLVCVNPPSETHANWVASLDPPAGCTVRYLPCEERSANAARNVGLEEARGRIVHFLDDDCLFSDPRHLERVRELHDTHPEILGFGGPYASPDSAPYSTVFYNAYTEAWLLRNQTADDGALVLLGGNASYKRELGGDDLWFDGALAYGGTETEFNHRLVSRGHRLKLVDQLAVVHDFREGFRRLARRAWKQGAGRRRNPFETEVQALRTAYPIAPKVNRPLPQWGFTLFVALYYALVRMGSVLGRANVSTASAPVPQRR
ncbi:MAG: glycosyltransferase family 2 protein [Planctomycetota bacterium]